MLRREVALLLAVVASCSSAAGPDAGDGGTTADGAAPVDGGGGEDSAGSDVSGLDAAGADAAPGDTGLEGQVALTFRVHVPSDTPAAGSVYITGDFQGWDPGLPANRLTLVAPLTHEITLSFDRGTVIQFKLTRGTWSTVEKGPNGEEIANRTATASTAATLELTVASWADLPPGPSTITGDVRTTTVAGFLSGRRVWIYLPPGYQSATDRYPVLYLLDGQNLFDQRTAFAGEWQVDETLERLIPAAEIEPIMVVGVDNSAERIAEYTPWADSSFGGGMAEAHLSAITQVLMPYINARYRTLTGPTNTGIGGSSLGGLFALYTTYTHPEIFGRCAALSPSLWWDGEHMAGFAQSSSKPAARVWMDMGTAESAESIPQLRAMRDVMVGQGFVLDQDLKVVEDSGAGHNEAAWARRFPDVVRFLFPP